MYAANDTGIEFIGNKQMLVLVPVTNTVTTEPAPAATLRVLDAAGRQTQSVAMAQPAKLPLPAVTPTAPSFDTMYSAVIDAPNIAAGMQLEVSLGNGLVKQNVSPKVGPPKPIKVVAVPIQIGTTTGKVYANAAKEIEQREPVSATQQNHALFTSEKVLTPPDTADAWSAAMSTIISELNALRKLEGAQDGEYYMGFVPSTDGPHGKGTMSGFASVVRSGQTEPYLQLSVTHEIGHNFGLPHAPCGTTGTVDTSFPYANATLGAGNRYIWTYLSATRRFLDATSTSHHDLMSYCTTYPSMSDYNHERARAMLKSLPPAQNNAQTFALKAQSDVLLVNGLISESGVPSLDPLKRFQGAVDEVVAQSAYAVRVTSSRGASTYPLAVTPLSHGADQVFTQAIPDPGEIQRIEILRNGQVIMDRSASAAAPATLAKALTNDVSATENNGQFVVEWNAATHPYATVRHVGSGTRVLALDARGGRVTLPVAGLPTRGRFEVMLSDGFNSTVAVYPR